MIKTKTWILIFSVLLVGSLLAAGMLLRSAPEHPVVQILQDGTCIREIDLNAVTSPFTLEIKDPAGGSNTVLVEHGRICVQHADCPDQVCVRRGWLSDSAVPIVCIPHRLVIQVIGGSEVDSFVK